jgi:hypothetical protein
MTRNQNQCSKFLPEAGWVERSADTGDQENSAYAPGGWTALSLTLIRNCTTTVDLTKAKEVVARYDANEANRFIKAGWTLVGQAHGKDETA